MCCSEVIYWFNFDHLCRFCRPDDWKFAAEELVKRFPDKVVVHREHAILLFQVLY